MPDITISGPKSEIIIRTTRGDAVEEVIFRDVEGINIATHRHVSKRMTVGSDEIQELIPSKQTFLVISGVSSSDAG